MVVFLILDKDYVEQYNQMGFKIPNNLLGAVYKRQNQFAAGRICAIKAAKDLLNETCYINQDAYGRPLWPNGLVGSIAHTNEIAIAEVVRSNKIYNIGIDTEKITNCPDIINSFNSFVLTEYEKDLLLSDKHKDDYIFYLYLIFSVKEAVYKCLNPLVNVFFDFYSVNIDFINTDNNKVELQLLQDLSGQFYKGYKFCALYKYLYDINHVYTRVVMFNHL